MVRPAPAPSTAWKTILAISSARSCDCLRRGTGEPAGSAGLYYSDFYSLWGFNGTTPNYSAYMDLGTLAPATTPNWFDAYSPTTLKQYAAFRRRHLCADRCAQGGRWRACQSLRLPLLFVPERLGIGQWSRNAFVLRPDRAFLDQLQPKAQSLVHFQPGDDGVCNRVDRLPSRRGQRGLSDHRCRLGLGLPAAKLYERQVALHLRAGPCLELRARRESEVSRSAASR